MKEKLKRLIDQYLREAKKHKVHHIEISLPEHDGRFWIIDASLITEQPDSSDVHLAIYFSVSPYTRKGKRLVPVIDLMDSFAGYQQAVDGRFTVYYLITDNRSASISAEVTAKIQALFPTLDINQVQLSLAPMDDWAGAK